MKLETEKQKQRRRGYAWYQRYLPIVNQLKSAGLDKEQVIVIMRSIDSLIDDARGYHYANTSYSAKRSLALVLDDVFDRRL